MKTIEIVANEIQTAKDKYGNFNSTHELYGVLVEEIEEFWNVVKEKNKEGTDISETALSKKQRMKHELSQIAAIALRGIGEIENNEIRWI